PLHLRGQINIGLRDYDHNKVSATAQDFLTYNNREFESFIRAEQEIYLDEVDLTVADRRTGMSHLVTGNICNKYLWGKPKKLLMLSGRDLFMQLKEFDCQFYEKARMGLMTKINDRMEKTQDELLLRTLKEINKPLLEIAYRDFLK
ncbi:MAG: hypothetical protein LBG88_01255, partial [Christensenellaceae bacterium]|nr:hypothetical protein [Christensenellaceae bacterium]